MTRLLLLLFFFCSAVFANEGMWLMTQLDELDLQSKGCQIDEQIIWNPDDGGLSKAIISLGGCSASFVSPNGLIATNHHCAYRALQRNSTTGHNYLKEGFVAESYKDELPTHGTEVYILQSFRNVTDQVLQGVDKDMPPEKYQKAIDRNIKKIVNEVEDGNPHLSATVAEMYSGLSYVLYINLRIKDVRIVYAPPLDIGKFGGDIDNFDWPRHTGDFAFLRAYVGPDGKPAEPSEDNVPYHPDKWLNVSTESYQNDDYQMVIGYPGRTARYRTSYSISYYKEFYYPWRIDLFTKLIELIEKRSAQSDSAAIKLSSLHSGLNNSLKNARGQLDGFERTNLHERKMEQEKEFCNMLEQNPLKSKKYIEVIPQIKKSIKEYRTFAPILLWSRYLFYINSVVGAAHEIVTWSEEKTKPVLERKEGYREKDIERLKKRWQHQYRNFDQKIDRQFLALFFRLALDLPEPNSIETVENITKAKSDSAREKAEKAFIAKLYRETALLPLETRIEYLDKSKEELEKLNDPVLNLAFKLADELDPLYHKRKRFKGTISRLRQQYIQAIGEDSLIYPDANSTKRLTFGYVQGYSPADAVWYDYFTTTDGILEKYTGEYPFNTPEKILELIKKKKFAQFRDPDTGNMHVNFLNTLDTTGGNSGSPVLNAKGELVGLLFDGNYESIVADYVFDPVMTRSICVDIRYPLWVMKYLDNADHLLNELKVNSH